MAIIGERETLTSLDFNFSSSGGNHSATVQSVFDAKDLSDSESELGTLIGSSAGKVTFSNDEIDNLMKNFIQVEKTVQQDGNKKTVSRKLQDSTSLRLKSHCFIVRGRDSHPHDKGVSGISNAQVRDLTASGMLIDGLGISKPRVSSGAGAEVILPYFGELPNSPITSSAQRFPFRRPTRLNGSGVIAIGNVYNEESSVNSDGRKTSLSYQSGDLKEKISFNEEYVSTFYKDNPDLSNYDLNFGYTLREAKRGFGLAGITLAGLPESATDEVLFSESGTLDSIASSIASKYGYYWFIDPFSFGLIKFINSASASQLGITNPLTQSGDLQEKYVNASFTQSNLSPKIVNAFGSTIEKRTQTFDFAEGQRYVRFHKLQMKGMSQFFKFDESLLGLFYGLYLSGKFDAFTFDALAHYATFIDKNNNVEWGDNWGNSDQIRDGKTCGWGTSIAGTTVRKYMEDQWDGDFNLKTGTYVTFRKSVGGVTGGGRLTNPSRNKIFGNLKDFFDLISSSIYVSNKFSQYKARRMQWGSSDMSISGPFDIHDKDISEVDGLQTLYSVLELNGFGNKKLNDIFAKSDSSGTGGNHGFVGIIKGNQRLAAGNSKKDFDYEAVNDENFIFIKNPHTNENFFGFSNKFKNSVDNLITKSVGMYQKIKASESRDAPNTSKAYYTRVRQPTDEEGTEEDRKQEEARNRRQAGLDAAAEKLSEVAERFDIRYFNVKTNGASGDPLVPITLDTKNGKISDIKALEAANFSARQSSSQKTATSSRTIVGISLPDVFSVTLSGLTLKLGSSGVTTTIQESTMKLLKPDEQLIINDGQRAALATSFNTNFSAKQKNFLGL
jgi:hypothetical protein